MKKKIPWLLAVGLLAGLAVFYSWSRTRTHPLPLKPFVPDAKDPYSLLPNLAFTIDGKPVRLFEGRTVEYDAARNPEWQTGLTTHQAVGDLNGDGLMDAAAVIVRSGGVKGSTYFVVAALATPVSLGAPPSPRATQAIPLGERIVVEQFGIETGKIHIRYLAYAPNEPTDRPPSLIREMRFGVEGGENLIPKK